MLAGKGWACCHPDKIKKPMGEKDKKSSLGETVGAFVVAAGLTWIFYKTRKQVWKWATANQSRGRIVVPILFWTFTFMLTYIAVSLIQA
jgi:hypothetical protein